MNTKQELMKRYAEAKLVSYRRKLGGEHEALVAARFAVMDAESDFNQRVRNISEAEAMAVLAMDVEDAERVVSC